MARFMKQELKEKNTSRTLISLQKTPEKFPVFWDVGGFVNLFEMVKNSHPPFVSKKTQYFSSSKNTIFPPEETKSWNGGNSD